MYTTVDGTVTDRQAKSSFLHVNLISFYEPDLPPICVPEALETGRVYILKNSTVKSGGSAGRIGGKTVCGR